MGGNVLVNQYPGNGLISSPTTTKKIQREYMFSLDMLVFYRLTPLSHEKAFTYRRLSCRSSDPETEESDREVGQMNPINVSNQIKMTVWSER